ncbi:MAG: transposase [Planctomycetota bacterium]
MATPPRFAIPGTYMITRRTLLRMFQLKPGPTANAILLYVLGLAATKYGILIHVFIFLSTHGHLLVTDREGGKVSSFTQYLFSLTARALNCHRGRRENLWSTGKPNCVWVAPRARDIVEKIAYILCNAVLSGLVDRMNKWPGVKVTADDLGQLTITVKRPRIFFSKKMPEEITFSTCLPECEDASEEELIARIRERCAELEQAKRSEMVDQGRAFLGVKAIRAADPFDSARSPDPLFELEPHMACKDPIQRVHLLRRLKRFRRENRTALTAFIAGDRQVVFPWGTLKMVHLFGCRCRGPDPNPTLGALAI